MALTRTLYGATVIIPETKETRWGAQVTNILDKLVEGANLVGNSSGGTVVPAYSSTSTTLTNGGTLTPTKPIHYVVGSGGPVTLSLTTPVAAGISGQYLFIIGTDNTNTVTLEDSGTIDLNSDVVLAQGEGILLIYNSTRSKWEEQSRTKPNVDPSNLTAQISWVDGLGAFTHILGPGDEDLTIEGDTGNSLALGGDGGVDLTLTGTAAQFGVPITFNDGLGAVDHITGPTDQNLSISATSTRSLVLESNATTALTLDDTLSTFSRLIRFAAGLGAVTQILGPSDQAFAVEANTGLALTLGGNAAVQLSLAAAAATFSAPIAFASGIGAVTQIQGPSDQNLTIDAPSSRSLILDSNGTAALTLDSTLATLGRLIRFTTGLGAVTQILGPTDQNLLLHANTSRDLVFGANATTYIRITSAGVIVPETDNFTGIGTTSARILNIRIGTGTSSWQGLMVGGTTGIDGDLQTPLGTTPNLLLQGDNSTNKNFGMVATGNNAVGAGMMGFKTRGTTGDANTIVQSGDVVFDISARAADGAAYLEMASIVFTVDATPGLNDMPGRISFSTTADGAASPTVRWAINSSGTLSQTQAVNAGSVLISKTGTGAGTVLSISNNGTGTLASLTGTADSRVLLITANVAASQSYSFWNIGGSSNQHGIQMTNAGTGRSLQISQQNSNICIYGETTTGTNLGTFYGSTAATSGPCYYGERTNTGTQEYCGVFLNLSNGGGILVNPSIMVGIAAGNQFDADVSGVTGTLPGLTVIRGNTSNFGIVNVGNGNNAVGATDAFFKTRSSNHDANTVVANNDVIANIVGYGADGAAYRTACQIKFEVDGTPGSSDMPGRMVFLTTKDGSASLTEHLRIANDGLITMTQANDVNALNIAHAGGGGTRGGFIDMTGTTHGEALCVSESGGSNTSTPTFLVDAAINKSTAKIQSITQRHASHSGDVLFISSIGSGKFVNTDAGAGTPAHLTNGGVWTDASCFSWLKRDVQPVYADEMLAGAMSLRFARYRDEKDWARNGERARQTIGAFQEDMVEQFGISEEGVSAKEVAFIALAALQGLVNRLEAAGVAL